MKPAITSRIATAAALSAALLISAAACTGGSSGPAASGDPPAARSGEPPPAPKTKVDVRGKVTHMRFQPDDSGVTLRIEGEKYADTSVDKASVSTKENVTKLFRRKPDGTREPITMMAFRNGQTVEATFTGPVAESYPVQATAAEIVIVGEN